MKREEALFNFFNQFGIPAYESSVVPSEAALPYLTFTDVKNSFNDGEVACAVNIWARTGSNKPLLEIDDALFDAIGLSGTVVSYDGGAVWIKRGSPWSQTMIETSDPSIKRRFINISLEYL